MPAVTPQAIPAYARDQAFEALFHGALDAVLVTDDRRHYVDANPAACELMGISFEEIVSRRVDDFASLEAQPFVESSWQQFVKEGVQRGEMRLNLPDGSTREVEYSAKANFVPGYHLSILRDCTQRKNTEIQLRESESLFRSLIEAIPQQVWTAQPDGALDYVSQSVLDYCGRSYEEMIGHSWLGILHPDDVSSCLGLWKVALATGQQYEVEFRLLRAGDKSYRWHLGRALPMCDSEGRTLKWFGTNTDITDRKHVEEERSRLLTQEQAAHSQLEADSLAKDEFLAVLSHELRTPLSAILGWSRMLREDDLDQVQTSRALEVIERSAKTQVRLVEDMLDVSRIVLGRLKVEMEPIELAPIVEAAIDVMRPAASDKGIRLEVQLGCEGETIFGDPYRLQQVVWNLLTNAIKFTPTGGLVQVHLKYLKSHLQIEISDSGQGINPQFLPHVFERFRQEEGSNLRPIKGSGTGLGLGLAIVRYLVEAQEGMVKAESPGIDQGATFTVSLPVGGVANTSDNLTDFGR